MDTTKLLSPRLSGSGSECSTATVEMTSFRHLQSAAAARKRALLREIQGVMSARMTNDIFGGVALLLRHVRSFTATSAVRRQRGHRAGRCAAQQQDAPRRGFLAFEADGARHWGIVQRLSGKWRCGMWILPQRL